MNEEQHLKEQERRRKLWKAEIWKNGRCEGLKPALQFVYESYRKHEISDTILKSVCIKTLKGYQDLVNTFSEQAVKDGMFLEIGLEYDYFIAFCNAQVRLKVSPETLLRLRWALTKLHRAAGIADNSWVSTRKGELGDFFKGLRKIREAMIARGEIDVKPPRFDMPEALVKDLVQTARADGKEYLAVGYELLYHCLFRHAHIGLIIRADVIFIKNSDDVMIYLWNFKQNADIQTGAYVIIKDYRKTMEKFVRGKKMEDRLFPNWSEDDAVKYLQSYCNYRGLKHENIDIHCFRGAGVSRLVKMGEKMSHIKLLGGWTYGSRRFETYARHLDPLATADVAKKLAEKPKGAFKKPPAKRQSRPIAQAVQDFHEKRRQIMIDTYGGVVPSPDDDPLDLALAKIEGDVEEAVARSRSVAAMANGGVGPSHDDDEVEDEELREMEEEAELDEAVLLDMAPNGERVSPVPRRPGEEVHDPIVVADEGEDRLSTGQGHQLGRHVDDVAENEQGPDGASEDERASENNGAEPAEQQEQARQPSAQQQEPADQPEEEDAEKKKRRHGITKSSDAVAPPGRNKNCVVCEGAVKSLNRCAGTCNRFMHPQCGKHSLCRHCDRESDAEWDRRDE